MIRARDGEIEMVGELTELTADVTGILHGYRDAIIRHFDEDSANKLFALVGRIAALPPLSKANPEEREQLEQYAEDFADIVDEAVQRKVRGME